VEILMVSLAHAGTDSNVLVLILLGLAVGILAGFFGMGGGWITAPALNILGFPMTYAVGTGLASITAQSAMATVKHRRMGSVDFRLGLITGGAMALGVEGGARVNVWLESLGLADSVVRWVYVCFLASLGAYMLYHTAAQGWGQAAVPEGPGHGEGSGGRLGLLLNGVRPTVPLVGALPGVSLWVLVFLGAGVGVLAGMMGSGGGFALVPAFVYLLGLPTLKAVGTSVLCVVVSASYGAFTYSLRGRVELAAVACILAGAVPGTQLGASALHYVRGRGVRFLYSAMLLLAAVGVLLKQFGRSGAAGVAVLGGAGMVCTVVVSRMVAVLAAERWSGRRRRHDGA
jgi:uncharacterized membrane protein YfcA